MMNSPHGWRLPYGPVDADDDWIAAGRRVGAKLTGDSVTISGVERAAQITRHLAGDETRQTTSYDVVLRTNPVTGKPVADDPHFGPWDELELEWFDAVPEDAYWEHGDAVDDIRPFLE